MALPAHLQVTWPELQKLPDDGKRHELIEGEHYIWTSPNTKHQKVSVNIEVEVGNFSAGEPARRDPLCPPRRRALSDRCC